MASQFVALLMKHIESSCIIQFSYVKLPEDGILASDHEIWNPEKEL